MAVPDSPSTLSMLGLAREKKYDNYDSTSSITSPISLADLFLGGDFFGSGESYETTNVNGTTHPEPDTQQEFETNGTTPLEMSAWYGYDHDYAVGCGTLYTYTFAYSTSYATACDGVCRNYRINSTNWDTATQLYTGVINSCTPANVGYYYFCGTGYANPVRYWNGNSLGLGQGCF